MVKVVVLFRQWVSQGEWHFDRATLQLRLSIPMNELIHRPRGYISPSQWDSGVLSSFFTSQYQLDLY